MEIRQAAPKDFRILVSLTASEGWGYTEDDFQWFDRVGGKTLVAANESEIVGMVTTLDYGNVCWISNLLVKLKERGHGIGTEILSECMRLFGKRKSLSLFSYERSADFYEANGFKSDLEAYLVSPMGCNRGRSTGVVEAKLDGAVLEMDRACFGFVRPLVIHGLAEKGVILKLEGGGGFAIVRKDQIEPSAGPVIAGDRDLGHELLLAALEAAGPNSRAVVLERGIEGLNYQDKIRRLHQGAQPKIDLSMAVAFAGLELG